MQSPYPAYRYQLLPSFVVSVACALTLAGCGNQSDLDREYRARFWETFQSDGDKAFRDLRFDAAKTFFSSAVEEAKALGANDFRLAISLDRLASVYAVEGDDKKAESLLERAVQVHERNAAPSNLTRKEMVRSYRALADVLVREKRFKDAGTLYTKAADAYRASVPANSTGSDDWLSNCDFVRSVHGLAMVSDNLGDNGVADEFYKKALSAARELKMSSPMTNAMQGDYAKFLRKTNRNAEAQRIEEARQLTGLEQEQAALLKQWTELHESGLAELEAKHFERAEELLRKALETSRRFGKNNVHVLVSMQDLVRALMRARKPEAFSALLPEAHALIKKSPDSKELDNLLGTVAKIEEHRKNWSDAEALTSQRVGLRERLRGSENEHVAETLYDLASIYAKQDKVEPAVTALKRALSILRKSPENKAKEIKETQELLQRISAD